MTIVADESVDFGIILLLRQKGISVLSITEEGFRIKDEEVLAIAVKMADESGIDTIFSLLTYL